MSQLTNRSLGSDRRRPGFVVAFALSLLAVAALPVGAGEPLKPWTTEDVIDQRIDVDAQYSLIRMFGAGLLPAVEASAMLSAIKDEQLGGIYQIDRKIPALRAREDLGTDWWKIIPSGVDAICWRQPPGKLPLIVYRKGVPAYPERLDAALSSAWNQCRIPSAPPRPYIATIQKPPPPPPPPDPDLPPLPPSGVMVIVTSKGSPVPGADVGLSDAAGGASSGITDDKGSVMFAPAPGPAELWVNGPANPDGSPKYESFFTLVEVQGGASQVIHVELDEMTTPPKPPEPECDEDKWHEVFNACGKRLLGDATQCLKDAHVGYWKCAGKGARKGAPADPVCAARVLAKFWACKNKLDHKQKAKECHDKANAESNCDFPMN